MVLSETRRVTNEKTSARIARAAAALTQTQVSLNQEPHLTSHMRPMSPGPRLGGPHAASIGSATWRISDPLRTDVYEAPGPCPHGAVTSGEFSPDSFRGEDETAEYTPEGHDR